MTIETKYNIGDEVWVSDSAKRTFLLMVYGMAIMVTGDKVVVYYEVGLDEDNTVLHKEERVFQTKEELLNSL